MKIVPSFLVTAFLVGTATFASAKPVRVADGDKPTKHERMVARFDKIDADDDGMISRAEFTAHHKERMQNRKERKADKAEKKADRKADKAQKRQAKKQLRRAKLRTKAAKAA